MFAMKLRKKQEMLLMDMEIKLTKMNKRKKKKVIPVIQMLLCLNVIKMFLLNHQVKIIKQLILINHQGN